MIESFHAVVTFFATENVIIDSYYTTDEGENGASTDKAAIAVSVEELSKYRDSPHLIRDIDNIMIDIIKEIYKKDEIKIYDIPESSVTFIAYDVESNVIFIRPFSMFISFNDKDVIRVNIGYGLYEKSMNDKEAILLS